MTAAAMIEAGAAYRTDWRCSWWDRWAPIHTALCILSLEAAEASQ